MIFLTSNNTHPIDYSLTILLVKLSFIIPTLFNRNFICVHLSDPTKNGGENDTAKIIYYNEICQRSSVPDLHTR